MSMRPALRAHQTRRRAPARTALAILLFILCPAATALAQGRDPVLAAIDTLIAAGRTADARSRLARWQAGEGARTTGDARAHALFLTGRLSLRWSDAETAYAGVALSYPTSPHAPAALLRLGQGLLAAAWTGTDGAALRAVGYLERLGQDYPNAPDRAIAMLWLARARRAALRGRLACDAANAAARMPADATTAALIQEEQIRSCSAAPSAATPPLPADLYGVQIGAFSTRDAAADLVARLSARGFEARITMLEGGSLFRVRAGRFENARDADALAQRIRAAGFDVVIVDDIRQEREVR